MEIKNYIENINSTSDIDYIRELLLQKENDLYYDKENFKHHNKIDNYIYVVNFNDGSKCSFCIGSQAYERFINDNSAINVQRKSKDLFPTYELLIEK